MCNDFLKALHVCCVWLTQKWAIVLTSTVFSIRESGASMNFFPVTIPALFTRMLTSPTSRFTCMEQSKCQSWMMQSYVVKYITKTKQSSQICRFLIEMLPSRGLFYWAFTLFTGAADTLNKVTIPGIRLFILYNKCLNTNYELLTILSQLWLHPSFDQYVCRIVTKCNPL